MLCHQLVSEATASNSNPSPAALIYVQMVVSPRGLQRMESKELSRQRASRLYKGEVVQTGGMDACATLAK